MIEISKEIGGRVSREPKAVRADGNAPLRRDYHPRKIAAISTARVRRVMLAEPRAWTGQELALATGRPTSAITAALEVLTAAGLVHSDVAYNHRQDIHGRKKVWLVRLTESDELLMAGWDRAIETIKRENAKLKDQIEWLEMSQ